MKAVGATKIRPARPLGVAVVALFLLADAGLTALEVLDRLPPELARRRLVDGTEFAPALLVVAVVLEVVAAVGLWRRSRRAWVLTMLIVGASLVADLMLFAAGEPKFARLAVDIVMAFYLNQGLVHDYFEPYTEDQPGPGRLPPPEPEPAPRRRSP